MDVGSEQDYDAYVDTVLELVNMQNAYENDPDRRVSPDAAVAYAEDAFDFEVDAGHADVTTYVDGENLMYGLDDNANLQDLEPLLDGATNPVIYHKRQQSVDTLNYGVVGCNDVNREMDDILMLAGAIRRSRFPGASVTVLSNDGYRWMTMQTDVEFESFDWSVHRVDSDGDDGDDSAEAEEPYVVVGPDGLDQAREPRVPEPKQDPVPPLVLSAPTVNDPRTKYLFAATAIAAIAAGFIWA